MHDAPLRIVMIAGEVSGDNLGGPLMQALKTQAGRNVEFSGIGGPQMQAAGLSSLFPMTDLSVMGIAEVLPKIPLLKKRIAQAAQLIEENRPDIVITIDAPDFSYRVAKKVQKRVGLNALCVHYVAPSVWAWRPGRARKLAELYNAVLCLLPFEPPYFEREGMKACFVGHPAVGQVKGLAEGQAFRRARAIPDDVFLLGILYGSRMGELVRMGPILTESIRRSISTAPKGMHIVAPTLPHLQPHVERLLADMPVPIHVILQDKWDAFASMDAALAVSGTVGLELALSGVPHVIAYRTNRLTAAIVRRVIRVKYAHLANILMDKPVVPEFIQDDCRADLIVPTLISLFNSDGAAATAQRTALAGLLQNFNAQEDASERAAKFVLALAKDKETSA